MVEDGSNWEHAVRWLVAQPENRELVEACYFDAPLLSAAERYYNSPEWLAIRALLPHASGRALDLGAGNGIGSYALARDGWMVDAVEPDPSALVGAAAVRTLAADADLRITISEVWGETLPFADNSFDCVLARQVLHHARSLSGLCQELHRVLRPEGRLVAVRDHVVSGPRQLEDFYRVHPLHQRYGGEHAYRVAEYRDALTLAGFQILAALGPFDSPINYAPLDEAGVRREVGRRVHALPLAAGLVRRMPFAILRRLLTLSDRRPGRLWSFVCVKPKPRIQ